jgi:competence protein ComGC
VGTSFKNDQGLTILDIVLTLCIIGILIGVVIPKYQQVARVARETALKSELSNIRTSIKLFKILNSRNPDSLRELMEKKVLLPGRIGGDPYSSSFFEQSYLLKNAVDTEGNKVDCFGNIFRYDRAKGEVRATTKGFEGW